MTPTIDLAASQTPTKAAPTPSVVRGDVAGARKTTEDLAAFFFSHSFENIFGNMPTYSMSVAVVAARGAQLKALRAEVAGLAPSLAEPLRQQPTRLTAVAMENEKALRMVHRAADRVLGIIAQAVRDHRTASIGYDKNNLAPR